MKSPTFRLRLTSLGCVSWQLLHWTLGTNHVGHKVKWKRFTTQWFKLESASAVRCLKMNVWWLEIQNNEVLTLKKYSKLEETGSRSVTFSKSALIDKSSRTIVDIDRYWLRFEAGRHFGSGSCLQAKFHWYPSRATKRFPERSLPWHLTHELRNRPTNSLDVLLVDSVRMTVLLVVHSIEQRGAQSRFNSLVSSASSSSGTRLLIWHTACHTIKLERTATLME